MTNMKDFLTFWRTSRWIAFRLLSSIISWRTGRIFGRGIEDDEVF